MNVFAVTVLVISMVVSPFGYSEPAEVASTALVTQSGTIGNI